MSLSVILIVLLAAVLHATWNTIVKTAADGAITLGLVALGHVLPGTVMVLLLPLPSAESFPYILLTTVIQFGYFYTLCQGYKFGDLSVVYPIARGIVPALVSLWAALFVGEYLPLQAWFGIGLIALGIIFSSWSVLRSGIKKRAVGFAIATGIFISGYSLTDGIGVRLSGNTLSYWAWGAVLNIFIVMFLGTRYRAVLPHMPARTWVVGIAGGMVSMIAYGLVLYAKNFAPLGAVSALRETSVIFAALIGFVFLKEGYWARRLTAAILMVAGVTTLSLAV